eukprot:363690-Chlamydomonas_euryale.AAC.3
MSCCAALHTALCRAPCRAVPRSMSRCAALHVVLCRAPYRPVPRSMFRWAYVVQVATALTGRGVDSGRLGLGSSPTISLGKPQQAGRMTRSCARRGGSG